VHFLASFAVTSPGAQDALPVSLNAATLKKKKLDHMVLMARTLAGVIGVTSGRVSHFEEQAGGIVHCPTKNFDRSQVLSFHRGTVERIICQN
jgi:hypothetical protein